MVKVLKIWWKRLSKHIIGKWFFSKIVSFIIPYTGSISPLVLEITPGFAKVRIYDRRRLRNHLRSLHALALANLGEFSTGLAVHFAIQSDRRAILINLSADYVKKARGKITAQASALMPEHFSEGKVVAQANLFDEREELVAKISTTWLVSKA